MEKFSLLPNFQSYRKELLRENFFFLFFQVIAEGNVPFSGITCNGRKSFVEGQPTSLIGERRMRRCGEGIWKWEWHSAGTCPFFNRNLLSG